MKRKNPFKVITFTPERRSMPRRPKFGLGAIITWIGIAITLAAFWSAILRHL